MSSTRPTFSSLIKQITAAAVVFSPLSANADLGIAKGFNAFIEQDFVGINTDVQGRLAAGGNIDLTSYGVATAVEIEPETASLIVGGDLSFKYGQVHQGGIWVAGSTENLGQDVRNGMAGGTSILEGVPLPFSIEAEFQLLRGMSQTLSYAELTGSVEYKWGGAYLEGDCESAVQVFQLDGAELDAANSFNLGCVPESATVVFNVSGTAPGISDMSLEALRSRSTQVLWNFYEAEQVNFSDVGVHGSILAPDAALETPWGFVDGTVIAKQWSGVMELHHYPFEGDISSLLPSEAPVIIPPPNTVGYESSLYEYPVVATDEDIGDVLTHSIDLASAGIAVDPLTGVISWLNPAGEYVGAVSEFNDQCYVVPTGAVAVVEDGDENIDQSLAVLTPLFKDVKEALEAAADYTAVASSHWDIRHSCLGCHVQTQALVGLGTSVNKVDVDEAVVEQMVSALLDAQTPNGSISSFDHTTTLQSTQNSLALWALSSYEDRARTLDARAKALSFMLTSQMRVSGDQLYWATDHNTGWLTSNNYATTALVVGAGVALLEDIESGLSFTEAQANTALAFSINIESYVAYFLDGYYMPNANILHSAFRLIALSDLRPHIISPTTALEVDEAIEFLDSYLRSKQNIDGGWARSTTGLSSPVASAWVGIALDKLNPEITDKVVVANIRFLLDSQTFDHPEEPLDVDWDGTWQDPGSDPYFPKTRLGPTGIVMAYLPVALDFLGNPDLNVAHIDLTEQGDVLNLTATISNRGIADTEVSTFVSFYAGEDENSPLLGRAEIPAIKSGQSAIASVLIGNHSLIGTDVFVHVENKEEIEECEIRNNTRRSAVIRHRVTDRSGLFDTQIYALNIEDANEAPVITSPAELFHQQAQFGGQQVTISDVDVGDSASFEITDGPEGITIDERTGKLYVDPETIGAGTYSFVVRVTDLRGGVAEQEITFTVEENLPPEITSIPLQQISEGEEYSYQIEAIDPNGDELRYGADLLEGAYALGSQSGLLRGDEAGPLEGLREPLSTCFIPTGTSGAEQMEVTSAAVYRFNQNLFADNRSLAPDLIAIDPQGSNSYVWDSVFGTEQFVYRFEGNIPSVENSGLILPTESILNEDDAYTVELVFKFEENQSTWENIFGVSNRQSDNAFYVDPDGKLEVWPTGDGPDLFSFDEYHHITLTNTGEGVVTAYFDGRFQFDLTTTSMDFSAYTVENPSRLLHLFADNVVAGGQNEFSNGRIAFLRVYDEALDASQVFEQFVNAEQILIGNGSDLAPFELTYDENVQTLSAVIANRGLAPVSGDVVVTFTGDDGLALGEVVLSGLDGATEQLVSLSNIEAASLTGMVTVAVSSASAQECISNNNQTSARVITVKAVDEGGLFDTQTFLYSVKNINDAPVITSSNTVEITQDQAVDYQVIVADPDLGDAHQFTLLEEVSGLSIGQLSGRIQASPNAFEQGIHQFTVQVTDLAGRTAEQVVLLTVTDVDNHKPIFTSTPLEVASAFTEYTYQVSATDEDGDELIYLFNEAPDGMQIDGVTGLVRWIPSVSQVGSQLVDIKVLDARGASDNQRFFIEVTNPAESNTPPTITSVPDSAVIAGQTFRYFVTAEDIDGDALMFSLEDAVHGMAITPSGAMTWLPSVELIGQVFTVTVKVSDGKGGEARQLLSLPVNEPANNPPTISNEPPTSAQQAQPYVHAVDASDPDGDALIFRLETKPAGMSISTSGEITWVPTQEQSEKIHQVSLRVEDARGAAVIQSFSVWVELLRDDSSDSVGETTNPIRDNKGPIIQGVPTSPAVVGAQYIYDIKAIDPDGDELSYELVGDTAEGLSISGSGVLTWTPLEEQVGSYNLAIAVSDGLAGLTQSFTLGVVVLESANNDYPEIISVPKTLAFVDSAYEYAVVATDPDGDVLSYSLLSDADGMVIDEQTGLLTWQPLADQLGIQRVQVAVNDGVLTSLQSFDINVLEPQAVPPLEVFVTASPSVIAPGDSVEIQVFAQGGVSAPVLTADVDGFQILLDDFGRAVITAGTFGVAHVSATAVNGEETADATTTFLVADASDVTAPTANIASPEPASEVSGAVDVMGTASDDNLVKYELFISPEGAQSWQLLAEGNTSVIDDVLGQIDTTLLMNGQYDLVLQVVDINNNVSSASTTVLIDDDIKVGNFSFTVEDLVIPMEGIPIQVTRTYDSRRRGEALDFGYGWTIDYQNVKLEESRTLGTGWAQNTVRRGPFNAIADLCIDPLGAPVVTVTLPTGEVEKFEVTASPNCNTFVLFKDVELVFTPVGDTLSTLEALDDANGYFSGSQLVETGYFSNPIDPQRYKLTTQAGFEYFIHKRTGIEKVIDPNGHTLTYTDDGIFHSSGKAVTFDRHGDGRIHQVVAPNGSKLVYEYDLFNNLEYVFDRDLARTQYTYNTNHGLIDIIDPMGRKVVKNLYDEQGRLYAQEDGDGVIKTFDHDLDARTSLVTDRDGRSTLFVYDETGNVTAETLLISDGSYDQDIVTGYSFDVNGNQETKTIGESTWTADFDERNNQLFAEDPEQNTIFYRGHNDRGQEGEIEDEMGRISTMDYDVAGNLIVVAMPEVEDPVTGELVTPSAGNNINRDGKVSSTTDATGFKTEYTYYPKGHDWEGQKETESNAITGTTTFTYDDNNNVKTETRERTVDGVVIEEMVEYEYDVRDRLEKTIFPDGTYTETQYDLAGNLDKERSRLGFWTDYDYDAYGRLRETLYPDNTTEIRTYTPEGLLETVTDRSGFVTRNEYDDAGRLWKVHNEQDGSYTEMRYTIQGWLEFEWDEERNLTQHVYDKAGRRKQTIRWDDEGRELIWKFEYYPNGDLQFEIDPLDRVTEYVINELDQRTQIRYADGTVVKERYDFMGRKLGTTDQNDREKTYAYDDAGRMTGVTPQVQINGEDVPETTYEYDEQGNQLLQKDANGHTTYWEYDYFGRVIKRTLPEGMFETFEYRDAENTVIHTDFNGDTITTVSDVMGRMETVTYSKDGRVDSYTYWDNDQVKTVTTPEGVAEYFYDERHRLDYEVRPDGTRMDYGYDLVGNRTLAKATFNGEVIQETRYEFDTLNRLHKVFDELAEAPEVPVAGTTAMDGDSTGNAGAIATYSYDDIGNRDTVTYANGLVTDYDFNNVNQLTDVFTRDVNGDVINHFHYALDNTGRRKVVTELSGRTTAYCHDDLYRLTEETVFATSQVIADSCLDEVARNDAIYTADYEYDWAGNRTYQTIDGVETQFVYDDNDRLQTQGGYSYGYDENGNTLTETLDGDITEFVYNGKNQLVSQTKLGVVTEFGYNPNGIRNRKFEVAESTLYLVDENRDYQQVLVEISNDEISASYLYGADLIRQQRAANDSFYHYDGLGSTRALSNSDAAITDTYAYAAFGEVLEQTGETENDYLYTGEQFDQELNQYYLRARYYDQGVGRFTSMDTWMGRNHDPITLNKYVYANADSANWTDPTGRFGLGGFSAGLNVMGVMAAASVTAVGLSSIDFSMDANPIEGAASATSTILWNIVAVSSFNNRSALAGLSTTTATTQETRRQRSPNDGHHTIPIYLCGARSQQLSSIDRKQHSLLHAGLALVEVAKHSAEEAADRMIPLTRRRSEGVMDLANSKAGRRAIAGAIHSFYLFGGWWDQGVPTIGAAFSHEKQLYINGNTSLPECTRARPR